MRNISLSNISVTTRKKFSYYSYDQKIYYYLLENMEDRIYSRNEIISLIKQTPFNQDYNVISWTLSQLVKNKELIRIYNGKYIRVKDKVDIIPLLLKEKIGFIDFKSMMYMNSFFEGVLQRQVIFLPRKLKNIYFDNRKYVVKFIELEKKNFKRALINNAISTYKDNADLEKASDFLKGFLKFNNFTRGEVLRSCFKKYQKIIEGINYCG